MFLYATPQAADGKLSAGQWVGIVALAAAVAAVVSILVLSLVSGGVEEEWGEPAWDEGEEWGEAAPVLPEDRQPGWFLSPPNEPGVALYGAGSGMFQNPAMAQLAMDMADAGAREALAQRIHDLQFETMVWLEGAHTLPEEMPGPEEFPDRQTFEMTLSGVIIAAREIIPETNGPSHVYSLARLSFETVVDYIMDLAIAREACEEGDREEVAAYITDRQRDMFGGDRPWE